MQFLRFYETAVPFVKPISCSDTRTSRSCTAALGTSTPKNPDDLLSILMTSTIFSYAHIMNHKCYNSKPSLQQRREKITGERLWTTVGHRGSPWVTCSTAAASLPPRVAHALGPGDPSTISTEEFVASQRNSEAEHRKEVSIIRGQSEITVKQDLSQETVQKICN